MTWRWPKRLNREKPEQSRTRIRARNVGIGHRMKTNDIIGSLSYIMSIFLISTWEGPIEFSSQWLPSSIHGKQSSAGATTRRCRKNTNTFQRFWWAWGSRITTRTTVSWYCWTWKITAIASQKSVYWLEMSWKGILRHRVHNKNKPKQYKSERQKPNTSNHRIPVRR